jgi:hypothetical protein
MFSCSLSLDCPARWTNPGDLCQTITANIFLRLTPDRMGENETAQDVVSRYEADVWNAIFDGNLQDELLQVRVDTPVTILTGLADLQPTIVDDDDSEPLSSTAWAGIAVGACVLVIAVALLARASSNTRSPHDDTKYAKYQGEESDALPERDIPLGGGSESGGSLYTDKAIQLAHTGGATTLGASVPDYGGTIISTMEAGEDLVAEPGLDDHQDDSSNAGSSGWSSSAGISSMNTGSMDDSMDAAVAAGATLASMGLASGLSRGLKQERSYRSSTRYVIKRGVWLGKRRCGDIVCVLMVVFILYFAVAANRKILPTCQRLLGISWTI